MAQPTTYRDWLVNGFCEGHLVFWDLWDVSDHPLAYRMCAIISHRCKNGEDCFGAKVYDASKESAFDLTH